MCGKDSSLSPRGVFERLVTGITQGAWDELPALYSNDAVVELPFAEPGQSRLVGRDEIRCHFAQARRAPLKLNVHVRAIHETGDPEVIVAEFDYSACVVPDGTHFTMSNIQVLRVRDGCIQYSRDYHDHMAVARALRNAGNV